MSHILLPHRVETVHERSDTLPRPGRRWSDRSIRSTVREIVLIATMFVLYRQVRHFTSGDLDQALSNADRVVGLERLFGVFSEASLQRLCLRSRAVIEFLDHYYVFAHFTASFGFMAWVFLRHPQAWGRIRSWFLSVTFAGLVIHVAFPLAPPRMLAEHGFVDTLHVYGPSIYSRDVTASAANQLAAMPSLHFAWAAIVAAGVISIRRSRVSLLVLLHPLVTLLAIVATANHYWLDAIVGAALVAAALGASSILTRRTPTLAVVPTIAGGHPVARNPAPARFRITRMSTITALPVLAFPTDAGSDSRRHDLTTHRRLGSTSGHDPSRSATCGHTARGRAFGPITNAPDAFGQTRRRPQNSASRLR